MAYRENVITREQLHDLVWTQPVMAVAERLGMTGTGLAKICKKLRVPVPPRGYWARSQAGHKVAKTPLPPPLRGQEIEHRSQRWLSPEAEYLERDEVRETLEQEFAPLGEIKVDRDVPLAHPAVLESEPILRSSEDVAATRRERACLAVAVGPDLLGRALRILDVLFRALDSLGYTVEVTAPRPLPRQERGKAVHDALPSKTLVRRADVSVELDVAEDLRVWGAKESRVLALQIANPENGVTPDRWTDMTSRSLEAHLREVVRGIVRNTLVKQAKVDAEREKQAAERARAEAEAQAAREQKMVQDLEARLVAWRQAMEIRSLLEEAERRRGARGADAGSPWTDWAERHAEALLAWAARPGA